MYFLRIFIALCIGQFIFSCKTKPEEQAVIGEKVLTEAEISKIKIEIGADKKAEALKLILEAKHARGFNGTVLVAQKDVVIYQAAFGQASMEDSLINNIDTKFQLASLSKTFTSVAVMKLVEQGKLGLDNTVKDYYPSFPYEGVTIRSLLCHRSGLPYYQYEFDKKVRSEKLFPSNMDMMNWFAKASPTPKPFNLPDHFFSYNNTNYAVLAALVEIASKKSFDQFMREEILLPSGMKDTYTANSTDTSFNINRTVGYQYGRKLPKDYYDNIVGDKGIFSTAPDLFKWYKALKSEKLLSKESLREMYTPRSFEHPGLRNYGYGFRLWVNDLQQTDYVYHTGWWKGYNTIMFFDLRSDFVVILLSNKYNKDVYNIKEIVDVLKGKSTSLEDNILDQ